ncbi:MAG: efflux RND transporter periplasmic adaptor subunit [Acidobacteriota bacterium]
MRKGLVFSIVVVLAAGIGLWTYLRGTDDEAGASQTGGAPTAPTGRGNGRSGGMGGAGGFRPIMTVELGVARRAHVAEYITVVGNLIGAATVDVVPKVSGRLDSVNVRLGDRVTKGQLLAKVEDNEIQQQVRQSEASFEVSRATVRQREADLKFSDTGLDRSKSLFVRNLIARQTLDDAQARSEAALAQVDLAKAQFAQSQSRLEELQINLANTRIVSPVNGFVGSRRLDPGAYVGPSSPVMSVVDIHLVRLVANLVEKDLKRVTVGMSADVDVDAFSGEIFKGKVARLAPVLDPATRTAQMEVEVPNPAYRLKPGMYARVRFITAERANALVIPRNALVDVEGKPGVFVSAGKVARFTPVKVGIVQQDIVEIASGLTDGVNVVTTGAGGLKDGDPIQLAGQTGRSDGSGRQAGRGRGSSAGR